MTQKNEYRLLIFIVAYNAEHRIRDVLERIPKIIFENYKYEILIIDDSSADKTFEEAQGFHEINPSLNIKILYNPVSQGYGGNQKLGYEYAIQNNFHIVLLLHGRGQYAPEVMEKLIRPVAEGGADAVIGSRMAEKGKSLRDGMPFYKYAGNKILTGIQNIILNTNFTDLHSGYRSYSVDSLKAIPFETNSNDFHFDSQIIIQLLLAKKSIKEVPIPPFYDEGIHDLNKIRYAWNVIRESVSSRLHHLSIFYRREYDLTPMSEEYTLKLGYLSSHSLAIKNVRANSKVLDIGGGQGRIALELKKKGCYVAGIDKNPLFNRENYDAFYQKNLETIDFDFSIKDFDYVLMLDILEHLSHPEYFLDILRQQFGLNQPKIIVTVPNIAFFINRFQLLLGNFNYGKEGILDKTHKRLFTFRTMKRTCRQCGYIVEMVKGIPAPYPKAVGNNFWGLILLYFNRILISTWRSLFAYQIYIEIRPTPVVNVLLEYSVKESMKRKDFYYEGRRGKNGVYLPLK